MDVFEVHQQLIADYEAFTFGFTEILDRDIQTHVDQRMRDSAARCGADAAELARLLYLTPLQARLPAGAV